MPCNKSNCVISLGLTIMDRCPECEKIDRAAEEAERIARVQAFAEANKWKPPPPPSVSRDGGKTWTRVDEPNRDPVTPEELESRATLLAMITA